jgi:hypothetical protein
MGKEHPLNSADVELLQTMTRVAQSVEAIVIEVAEIHWLQTHTPFTVWHPLAVLPSNTLPSAVEAAKVKLLQRKKFFAVFGECGQRQATGYMHSATLCSSCAESNHSVVY